MSASRTLAGNANLARAVTGAIAVVAGGTVVGTSSHTELWNLDQNAAEEGETNESKQQQQPTKSYPLLDMSSKSFKPIPFWSVIPDVLTSVCESQKDRRRFVDSSYPDLSRFGPASYLRKYLTPEVYASLKDKKTKNGVTLEDIIRSGVSLPWGAKPPRGTGVYAGDEESYHVFSDLLVPIIEDYHRYHFVQGSNQPDKQSEADWSNYNSSYDGSSRSTRSSSSRNSHDSSLNASPSHLVSTFVTAMSPAMVLDEDRPMYGHNSKSSGVMLRRQFTTINKNSVLNQQLDPTGDYILQTRMRVARSIKGFPFSPVISRGQRRELEGLFETMVEEDWKNDSDDHVSKDEDEDDEFFGKIINNHGGLRYGTYIPVMNMSNDQHNDLIQRHILFHDPDEYNISVGIGRDWPDARGIYLASSTGESVNVKHDNPDLMIWLNKEDHMRIIATSNGGDLLAVFKRLSKALTQVEQSLHKRGHAFCTHPRYGFVNTSPENLGTALRASVYIKLYRLGQQPGFEELLDRLRLESSSRFKDKESSGTHYTGIFDVANAERLGQSEIQLVNTMINGVGRLIELEKRLEKGETVNLEEVR